MMTAHRLIDAIYRIPDSPEAWLDLLEQFATEVENSGADIEDEVYQHLSRAIQLGMQINKLESRLHAHKKTLDLIQTPAVMLNEAGDMIEVNQSAEALFQDEPLFQPETNTFRFSKRTDQKRFAELISRAGEQAGMHALSFKTQQEDAITLGLVALSQGNTTHYLMLINGSRIKTIPSTDNIGNTLGLTPKESKITRMVAEGRSLQAIADLSFNSYETIRTHLKRIFVKTGCSSQMELLYKVYSCCLPEIESQEAGTDLPQASDHIITLSDGRRLSYCIYGPKEGFPLVLHHTIEGSRKQIPLQMQSLFRNGIRVIVADRPGYGQSTYVESRTLHDWPNDLAELLTHLDIKRFALMGKQFGAEYALACAQHFDKRVVSTHLVSMSTPPDVITDAIDPFSFTRAATALARKAPKALKKIVHFASRKYRHRPRDFMKQVMMFQSEDDHALLADEAFVEHAFAAWLVESL